MSDFKKYLNVYEFETTLPGSGEVIKYKPITTGQLKKLLIYEDDDDPSIIEEALDDLITSSVISEGFDVTDLKVHIIILILLVRNVILNLYKLLI
jgi:hypothetical protein